MRQLITDKNSSGALALLPKTFSIIDRSAKLGVIKKNTAARYKSKLHLRIKSLPRSVSRRTNRSITMRSSGRALRSPIRREGQLQARSNCDFENFATV